MDTSLMSSPGVMMLFGLSPILALGLGGLLLMLAEAFGRPVVAHALEAQAIGAQPAGPEGQIVDAGAGRAAELALGAAVILFAGAIFSVALWLVGPENVTATERVAPYLLIDRFSVF